MQTRSMLGKHLFKGTLLVLTTVGVGLAFWFPLRNQVRSHLRHITRLSAQSVQTDVADELRAQALAQVRLAHLWADKGRLIDEGWNSQARLFASHHPGCLVMEIVDLDGRTLWSYDERHLRSESELREKEVQLNGLFQNPTRTETNEVLFIPLHISAPHSAHAVVVPIRHGSQASGFLVTVFDDAENLQNILNDHANLGYGIVVVEGTNEIYRMPGVSSENEREWGQEAEMPLPGTMWRVRVWPRADLLREGRSKLPLLGFITGSVIGLLLFSAIDFGRTAYRGGKALRVSQERLQAIISSAMDAIITVDESQIIVVFNSAAEKIFCCPSSEAIGKPLDEFLPARFRKAHREHIRSFGLTGASTRSMDASASLSGLRSNGQEFPIEASISQTQMGTGKLYTVIIRDITIRKQAEEALLLAHTELEARVRERTAELHIINARLEDEIVERQQAQQSLQELSGRLMHLRDEEQRRIARELHDSTVQILGAASIELEKVQKLLPTAEQNVSKIDTLLTNSSRLVEQATAELRTLSYLLHPPILDDLGLGDVLPWYAAGFTSRSGIQVEVDVPNDFGRLSYDIELTIFRIVQECLANIHRHSGSSTARISLASNEADVCVQVCDHGTGIHLKGSKITHDDRALPGVGIAGMRERVRQLGGIFKIESDPHGTLVRATLPIHTGNSRSKPKDTDNRSKITAM